MEDLSGNLDIWNRMDETPSYAPIWMHIWPVPEPVPSTEKAHSQTQLYQASTTETNTNI